MLNMTIRVCYLVQLQLYLQARFTWSGSKLVRHFLQVLAIYLVVWVGLSRISDYRHHWSDVLSAAIIGTLFACLMVRHHLSVHLQIQFLINRHNLVRVVYKLFLKRLMNWPI